MSEEALQPATTPVGRGYRRLLQVQRPQYGLSDQARADRCDAIAGATANMMRHPAETPEDSEDELAAERAASRHHRDRVHPPEALAQALSRAPAARAGRGVGADLLPVLRLGQAVQAGRRPAPALDGLCWSHARRKFFELADIAANARRGKDAMPISPMALEAVTRIDALFEIERAINGLPPDQRMAVRTEKSAPLIAKLEAWMRAERARLSRYAPIATRARFHPFPPIR